MRITKILLTLVLVLFSLPCYATNYYVLASATGTGSGLDWTNACTTIAAAETILQTAGRAAGGDTIYVGDGAYANATFNVPSNGTAVITIKKSTVADHGTETGYVEADHNGQAVITATSIGGMMFTTPFWIFDGVSRATETTGHGFKVIGLAGANTYGSYISTDYITIRYVEFTSPTVPIADGCIASATCTRSALYLVNGSDYVTLEYSYLHDLNVPIMELGTVNFILRYSVVARNDSTTGTHSEVISMSYNTSSNTQIYNNKFYDIEGTSFIAVMNSRTQNGLKVYNNIAYSTSENISSRTGVGNGFLKCLSGATACNNFEIYNNTIVNSRSKSNIAINECSSISTWTVKNNLVLCTDDATYDCDFATSTTNAQITYDNNWYSGVTYNASENGAINGGTENPFTASATYDFSLKAASGPVGVGTDIAMTSPDYAGNVRSSVWDIGALEQGEAAPDTDTPDITTIVIDSTGTVLTITLDEDVTVVTGGGFTLACTNAIGEGLSYVSELAGVLTFNITGVAIDDDDTCTLDYATIANDIQDAAGNDLETIGDPVAVDNQSTNTPEAVSYTVTVSVGEGCSLSPARHQTIETGATASITCTGNTNYQCTTWTGTCSGSGTTSWSATITGDCTATQPCQKIASDATIGSGCAITVGSGPAIKVY